MSRPRIPLVRDTIGQDDMDALADWLRTAPRLTKGPLCDEFERRFADWQGRQRAHFVNSGSSANLLAIHALLATGRLDRGDRIIAPAVSWTTTVAPISQLACEPVLCDCDPHTLGLDLDHLERLASTSGARALILCHVLGIPNPMDEVLALCARHGLALVEDCCEALGSRHRGVHLGNFGDIATFSFYFGHHISTIEGGMVCTDHKALSAAIRSLRSHGWNRDLDEDDRLDLRRRHDVDAFSDQYTFYLPGYNFRGTDLGAFLGLRQLDKLPGYVAARTRLWSEYSHRMEAAAWKPRAPEGSEVSGFAWPLLSPDRAALGAELARDGIETRPLVSGSIGRQPWFIERHGAVPLDHADVVHRHGLYVPLHPELTGDEVQRIAEVCLRAGAGSVRHAIEPAR